MMCTFIFFTPTPHPYGNNDADVHRELILRLQRLEWNACKKGHLGVTTQKRLEMECMQEGHFILGVATNFQCFV